MKTFISESEFEQIREQYTKGEVQVTLPRLVARQFFLRIQPADVKQTTGQSVTGQKALIWLMNIAAPIAFAICMVQIGTQYGAWEASLLIPIAGICWTVIYGLTSDQGGWLVGTVPLILSGVVAVQSSNPLEPIFLFVLSIWLQRASYLLSDLWLTSIVMSSFEAFEMMEQHIEVEAV